MIARVWRASRSDLDAHLARFPDHAYAATIRDARAEETAWKATARRRNERWMALLREMERASPEGTSWPSSRGGKQHEPSCSPR